MPLKLVPPRAGKTPFFYVRGHYLGHALDRSTQTADARAAGRILKTWREQIERGEYRAAKVAPADQAPAAEPTFLSAAVAYMRAGGERRFLSPIIELTGAHALRDKPLSAIDQIAIDNAAAALFPNGTAQTKNRQFYSPVAAVLHHGGIERKIKRPKGWRGSKATSWLEPEQAFRAFAAAQAVDLEFGILCTLLCYTGMRITEPLRAELRHLNLAEACLYLPKTKNAEARMVHLPQVVVTALANHPRGLDRHPQARLFRFHKGGRLYAMLKETWRRAGIALPRRQAGFHVFCHTYGTWMHRYGGLDTYGLTRTERWKDPRSADRYRHTMVSEEARRADLLPVVSTSNGRGKRRR